MSLPRLVWIVVILGLQLPARAADMIWRDRDTGTAYMQPMNGVRPASTTTRYIPTTPPNWELAEVGDFNADGKPDLIWRNRGSGATYFWFMDENWTTIPGGVHYLGTVPPTWKIDASGDFDGDGRTDLVWRNRDTGAVYFWLLDGMRLLPGGDKYLGRVPENWEIGGCGDFNEDGNLDLIWRNRDTGAIYFWLLDGITLIPGGDVFLGMVPTNWFVNGVGDFNGDSKSDIVWRNGDTGATYVWLLNGTTLMSGGDHLMGTIHPAWEGKVISVTKTRWIRRRPRVDPGARGGFASAAMPGKTILFGGVYSYGIGLPFGVPFPPTGPLGDTWEWNGSTWRQLFPRTSPGPRVARMVHDEHNSRLLMYGGGSSESDDLWAFNGADWTPIVTEHHPRSRGPYGLAYDSDRSRLVMWGGSTIHVYPDGRRESVQLTDTWEFDGQDWIERHPQHVPPVMYNAAMSYDPIRRRTVLLGTNRPPLNGVSWPVLTPDTWVWDGEDWTKLTTAAAPRDLYGPSMAFHAGLGEMLLFGGSVMFAIPFPEPLPGPGENAVYSTKNWLFDGERWTSEILRPHPPGHSHRGLAYDPLRKRAVRLDVQTVGPPHPSYVLQDSPKLQTWELVTPPGQLR